MNKAFTVTVCIPAYNEEREIKALLTSVIAQHEEGFRLQKIIVLSDGSTDATVTQARNIKDARVHVIDSKQNKGRIARRNELLSLAKTDVMIFLDADGVLENESVLSKLVLPFFDDEKLMLVGGNPYSLGNNTFLSKGLAIPRDAYLDFKYQINQGNNILGCMGSMLAIRKALYSQIMIPDDIDADDAYMYLYCISHGFHFRNIKDAKVIHHFPETVAAHIHRNSRHAKATGELKKYFGELVAKEYAVPRYLYLVSMARHLVKDPVHGSFVVLLNAYARALSKI